jgi:hypothetical protein
MKNINSSIKETLLTKIKRGDITQKPRWQFILKTALYYCGFLAIVLSCVYVLAFIGLIARERALFDLFSLGPIKMGLLLEALPWMIVLTLFIMSFILYVLVRRYAFVYSKSVLYGFGSLSIIVILVAIVLYSLDPKGRIPCIAIEAGVPGVERIHMKVRQGKNLRPCRAHPLEDAIKRPVPHMPPMMRQATSAMPIMIALIDTTNAYPAMKKIGCDNVVLVERATPKGPQVLRGAITSLLEEPKGELNDLYNYIATGDLAIETISVENGNASISFRGTLPPLQGVCDAVRFQAQVEETALQFDSIKSVKIFINGKEYSVPNEIGQ